MSRLSYNSKKNKILLCSIAAVTLIILCILIFRHIHSYGEWELYSEPTCSSYGVERRYCDCGEMQDRRIDMLPHTEGEWEFDEINSIRKKKCSVCGSMLKYESMLDHTHAFSKWLTVSEETCTKDGLQTRSCECGLKQENVIQAKGHKYSDWEITIVPDCKQIGKKQRICHCGHIDEQEIAKLDHIMGSWTLNGIFKEYPCINCGDILSSEPLVTSSGLSFRGSSIVGIGSCKDKDIVIPEEINGQTIESISKKAFQQNSNIESIILPNTVISIGSYAFNECSTIKQICLGNGLTEIGEHAFDSCANLLEIYLPYGISVLRESTFTYCVSLREVNIPRSVTKIEAMVFYMCNSLTDIYYDGTLEEWNTIEKDDNWNVGIEGYTIHCIDGEIEY